MRARASVMTVAFVCIALVSAGDGWGMSFEEMEQEMRGIQLQARTYLDMYYFIPMRFSGTTGMKITGLCVAGDSLRPKDAGKSNMDMGKAPAGNQISIPMYLRMVSEVGDHIILYNRMVTLPACK